MKSPRLSELPAPVCGKIGWPWAEESHSPLLGHSTIPSFPKISVVIPSYNQGEYLEASIRSILLQGYPSIELIIVDGGSSDNSSAIINKYHNWISWWVSEPDRGQSHAINKGFEHATGDLVTFLSTDDFYLPGTLQDVAHHWADSSTCGAIIGGFRYLREDGKLSKVRLPVLCRPAPTDLTIGPPGVYRLHQVATFYIRAALDEVGRRVRDDLHYTMDRELLYRVCRRFPIHLVNRPYGVFRLHSGSKSTNSVLAFAKEFEQLYLQMQNGDESMDERRRWMARHHRAKGFLKYAKVTTRPFSAMKSLFQALRFQPELITRSTYLSAWLEILRIKRPDPF
ncbi:MAG: glycosyltransferase [Desulfobacteraceae bacterium]|nr:MAG: glycosyltransferase [Desulfobacteraceae bacterium]